MMISREYCQVTAQYNSWQNKQLIAILKSASNEILHKDRGAFFGSILGTLNHLLWGDTIWMSRFGVGSAPNGGIPESVDMHPVFAGWSVDRSRMDEKIILWTNGLDDTILQGEFTWLSSAKNQNVTLSTALCIMHFFNHQTHHRGQVHAMMTGAGLSSPVSDLVFMP